MSDASATEPSGRERLIEAAVRLFGRDGFDATSVRAVADEAGVSWGLIRFYFGSKEGLLEAAEERVVEGYLDRVAAGARSGSFEELMAAIDRSDRMTPSLSDVARFLRRAIIEERPMALDFIRRLMSSETPSVYDDLKTAFPGETWMDDPVSAVASRLGALMAAPQFQALLGRDIFSPQELKRRNAGAVRQLELIRLGLEAERKAGRGGKIDA
jgi:AcrR family transcriptional regulator